MEGEGGRNLFLFIEGDKEGVGYNELWLMLSHHQIRTSHL